MLRAKRRAQGRCTHALAIFVLSLLLGPRVAFGADEAKPKPSPDEVLAILKAGNARFVAGKTENPHTDAARLQLAGSASQADYAFATVLTCSDSRVPVERIFDAGVMDLFVIRVAGNVCNTDEIGSIEYGLAHVRTPVLVILGHTQCGAVTAVTQHLQGQGHALERNIPPLIKNIEPAVKRAMQENATLSGPELVAKGIEANVWCGIENVFRESPAVRELAGKDKVKVIGGVYDVGTGRVSWLPENMVHRLLGRMEMDPHRMTEALAHNDAAASHGDSHADSHTSPSAHRESDTPAAPKTLLAPLHEPIRRPAGGQANDAHSEQATPIAAPDPGDAHRAKEPKAEPAANAHGTAPLTKPATHEEKPSVGNSGHGKTAATEEGATEKSPGKPKSEKDEKKEPEAAVAAHEAAAVQEGRPWGLIAGCGIIFLLGLGVALGAHFMKGKPEAKAAAPAGSASAAPAAAKTPGESSTATKASAQAAPATH